jgi:hypothetical protein
VLFYLNESLKLLSVVHGVFSGHLSGLFVEFVDVFFVQSACFPIQRIIRIRKREEGANGQKN